MGKLQRERGAAFEREIAKVLTQANTDAGVTGEPVKRILGQARDAGHDLAFPPFAVEAKRRRGLAVMEWLKQCRDSVGRKWGEIPLVIARADGEPAVAVLYLTDFLKVTQPYRAIHADTTNARSDA